MATMTSNRPYLIRAIYEWIVDNGMTPYLMVNAEHEGVQVPLEYVQDGNIILNLAPTAVRGLNLGNEWVKFSARFGGVPRDVQSPVSAVLAIYARENGRGMVFRDEEPGGDKPPPGPEDQGSGKPTLRVVK